MKIRFAGAGIWKHESVPQLCKAVRGQHGQWPNLVYKSQSNIM
jgi:hypothetical protein